MAAGVLIFEHDFGLVNIMSLHVVETELKQHGHRVCILNAFGNGFDIAFGRGAEAEQMQETAQIREAFEPAVDEWNGVRRVQLKVIDWQPA